MVIFLTLINMNYATILLVLGMLFSCEKDNEMIIPGTEKSVDARFYVSPDGSDANPGTIEKPFASWQKAWNASSAGDLIYIRGGVYRFTGNSVGAYLIEFTGKSGTKDKPIRIYAFPGEKPVFELDDLTVASGYHYALYLNHVDYVQLKGLRISGFKQPTTGGGGTYGMVLSGSNHNTIEQCEFDHVGGFPFWIGAGSTDNLVLNCDSHNNADALSSQPYGGADGFHIGADAGAINTFRGCRSWWNSDDGWDLFGNGTTVNFENCWSFWNGYYEQTYTTCPGDGIGFKLGANNSTDTRILRTLKNCLAFDNAGNGFDQNFNDGTTAHFPIALFNCTAYNNSNTKGGFGFRFAKYNDANVLRNNIGFNNRHDFSINAQTTSDHNSWNEGYTVTSGDFISLDTTGITGPRQEDGSLPDLNFLKLAPGSDLIDTGAEIGLPFNGTGPDLGTFESR
jgi:hypothetical protein